MNENNDHLNENRRPQNLPEESLASLDEWGDRIFIYPAKVRGLWNRRRKILHYILMLIFLILPWIKIGGHQAVLINVPDRQFAFFGLTFWAHDSPLMFFVLALLTMGLAWMTAIWGRVWCGWACPQTVFIETIFRKIESLVEGNHIKRRRLNESELSIEKASKKTIKWFLYTGASLLIAHSFLAYFVGTNQLLQMVQSSPKENWVPFLIIVITTLAVLFDFAWFREQFCIIMCPYGRFQSVLMDHDSLSVAYDVDRGEPRRGVAKDQTSQGDCIDCKKCVAVCPTGIDIRNGLQMECIACTACIDACDEVMEKIKKPKGLIRYATENELTGKISKILRPRVILYTVILILCLAGLFYRVNQRQSYYVSFVRALETPYKVSTFADGNAAILNHYKVSIRNQEFHDVNIQFEVDPEFLKAHRVKLISPMNPAKVGPGKTLNFHIFVQFERELTNALGSAKVPLLSKIISSKKSETNKTTLSLVGPRHQ